MNRCPTCSGINNALKTMNHLLYLFLFILSISTNRNRFYAFSQSWLRYLNRFWKSFIYDYNRYYRCISNHNTCGSQFSCFVSDCQGYPLGLICTRCRALHRGEDGRQRRQRGRGSVHHYLSLINGSQSQSRSTDRESPRSRREINKNSPSLACSANGWAHREMYK